jgi:hypothetical protein
MWVEHHSDTDRCGAVPPEGEAMMTEVKYPHIKVKLVGEDGNAFAIMGRVSKAMRRADVPKSEIDQFYKEATSGDYNHLLQTCMSWVDCL